MAGAETPYAQALALQDSFRDGSFTYSLAVQPGHVDLGDRGLPLRHPDRLLRAVRRHLRGHGPGRRPPGPGRRRLHPRRPRPARRPVATSCGARTPTPGPRSTSPASAGWPSSRRRAGARPGAEAYTGVPEAAGHRRSLDRADGRRRRARRRPDRASRASEPGEGGTTTSIVAGRGAARRRRRLRRRCRRRGGGRRRRRRPHRPRASPRSASSCWRSSQPVPLVAAVRALRRRRRRQQATTGEELVAVIGHEVTERVGLLGLVRRRWETDARVQPPTRRRAAASPGSPPRPAPHHGCVRPRRAPAPQGRRPTRLGDVVGRGRSSPAPRGGAGSLAADRSPATRAPGPRPVTRARKGRPVGPRIRIQPATVER